jgi:hypothetical protein
MRAISSAPTPGGLLFDIQRILHLKKLGRCAERPASVCRPNAAITPLKRQGPVE